MQRDKISLGLATLDSLPMLELEFMSRQSLKA